MYLDNFRKRKTFEHHYFTKGKSENFKYVAKKNGSLISYLYVPMDTPVIFTFQFSQIATILRQAYISSTQHKTTQAYFKNRSWLIFYTV